MKEFIEKLIKQLEERIDENHGWEDDEFFGGQSNAFEWTISVINKLSKEYNNDCCEWSVLHEGCFIQNPHTKRLFSNEESMQNVYCNTCGKKIKKVS